MRKFTEHIIIALVFLLINVGSVFAETEENLPAPPLKNTPSVSLQDMDMILVGSRPMRFGKSGVQVGCILLFKLLKGGRQIGAVSIAVDFSSAHCSMEGKEA